MFKAKRVLTLDVGASKLVLAEFSLSNPAVPELVRFSISELDSAPGKDADASASIIAALRDVIKSGGYRPGPVLLTLSGQAAFPRYVKLPPVPVDKIQQMIRYEAEQNVPFPIAEVVWDYQLIGDQEIGEQDVLLVAVKTESVSHLTDCVLAAGLDPDIVDVAPLALYNCVRYNYPDATGCTLVLDIGARNTNLLCIEENRVFTRSIPVAGNTITQEIAKSFQVDFNAAETLKCKHAMVALGGVYESSPDPDAERISKIVRNVVTRLHAEVNRSINFYRSQQNGSPPARVLLTGGSSIIPYMDRFFEEKLRVEVNYLNPFVNIAVSPRLDADQVTEAILNLGEVAGLALRKALSCPIEVNLLPPERVREKNLQRRLPYFGLAAAGLVLTVGTWALHAGQMRRIFTQQMQQAEHQASALRRVQAELDRELREHEALREQVDLLGEVVARRSYWSEVLNALNDALLPGMWLMQVEPLRDDPQRVTQLRIQGRGFSDVMDRAAMVEHDRQLTAVERLRDRLNAHDLFSRSEIVNLLEPEIFLREFVVLVGLEETTQRNP